MRAIMLVARRTVRCIGTIVVFLRGGSRFAIMAGGKGSRGLPPLNVPRPLVAGGARRAAAPQWRPQSHERGEEDSDGGRFQHVDAPLPFQILYPRTPAESNGGPPLPAGHDRRHTASMETRAMHGQAATLRHSSAQRRQASAQRRQCSASCLSHSAAQASQISAHRAQTRPANWEPRLMYARHSRQILAQSIHTRAHSGISPRQASAQ